MSASINYAFLHGGGQGSWVWQETVEALERQTGGAFGRALTLDAPGCGAKRGRHTDDLTMEDVAHELIADLESAGMNDIVLVGHSQAGQPMAIMAELRPDMFRRLVYVSCSMPLPGQNVQQMIGTGLHGSNEHEVGWPVDPKTSEIDERYSQMFCNDMDEAETSAFLAKLGKDMWPRQTYSHTDWRYGHFGALPATYIICLQDLSLPVHWQEIFAGRFKAERLVRIDAGHQAMTTRPEALAEILRHEPK